MPKRLFSSRKQVGLAPGTIHKSEQVAVEPAVIQHTSYNPQKLDSKTFDENKISLENISSNFTDWVHVEGPPSDTVLQALATNLQIHPLILEDITSPGQRPKIEEYDNCIYIHIKHLKFSADKTTFEIEPVNIVFTHEYLLSFQEIHAPIFNPIQERLKIAQSRLRGFGEDYLAYALMDVIVDNYFAALDTVEEKLERIEHEVIHGDSDAVLHEIHQLRKELMIMRKITLPTIQICHSIPNLEITTFSDPILPFLRDLEDHLSRVTDTIDLYLNVLTNIMDLHYNIVNNRTNETMKVLTVTASIFIPLTFLAGIYGMNFKYMPELDMPYAYPTLWTVMFALAAGLLYFFKRKKLF